MALIPVTILSGFLGSGKTTCSNIFFMKTMAKKLL
jgi:G3E family GTPase